MKAMFFSLLLWGIVSTQSFAIMVSPTADISADVQSQYLIELKAIGYFYHLRVYDANHIILDSTIQFTRGHDLDAFIVEGDKGGLEVLVVMSLDDDSDSYDVFSFDGYYLSKNSND